MIHSVQVQNFLSFRGEITLSFEATKDRHLENYHVVEAAPGIRLLKFLVVYGYNASGKSNLIDIFSFLHNFWFEVQESKKEETGIVPFLLDPESREKPTIFNLQFYVNTVKYKYQLKINRKEVVHESLDYYPGLQPANIFNRITEKGVSRIKFGPKLKVASIVENEVNLKCLPNMSVFAAYNQVNTNIKNLNDVHEWIQMHMLQPIDPQISLRYFAEDMLLKESDCKEKILNYLKRADFNVSDIVTKEIENKVTQEMISKFKSIGLPADELERLEKERSIKTKKTDFEHNVINRGKVGKFPLPMDLQSEGTKRIFGLAVAIYKTLKQNAFLAIDEIESKLHPQLIEYFIEQFLRESESSQLLVATHYDNLFDEHDLLRKDNFWFTEKGKDASTKLYPLSSFQGLNRLSSLQKAYKFGKFGAIPNID